MAVDRSVPNEEKKLFSNMNGLTRNMIIVMYYSKYVWLSQISGTTVFFSLNIFLFLYQLATNAKDGFMNNFLIPKIHHLIKSA